jgi:ferric-dicitrate binding protein FerR (iron transport regulator)
VSNPVPVPVSPDLAEALQALSTASGLPVHLVLDRVLSSTQPEPRRSTHRRSRMGWLALIMAGAAAAALWPALSGRKPR